MMDLPADQTLEDRIADRYGSLSAQLRKAADYVLAHPLDIVSRSLRTIAAECEVSPATFSRLARALDFDSFEQMKDLLRATVGRSVSGMSERAERLRQDTSGQGTVLQRQGAACIGNIEALLTRTDTARMQAAADVLRDADNVVLVGALSSRGIAAYMAYVVQYFRPNWSQDDAFGGRLARLGPRDAVLIITKHPYADRAVKVAGLARAAGARVIVVTDSYTCPALPQATHGFVVPTDSPQFFSSYVATLVLIESLIAMIVAGSEEDAAAAIRRVEAHNQTLGEYWTGP